MTLATKYVSYLDFKARLVKQQKDEEKDTPVMELLTQNGLEPERKKRILTEYIATLRADLKVAEQMMKELE